MSTIHDYTTRIFLNDEQAQEKIKSLRDKIEEFNRKKEQAFKTPGKQGDKMFREAEKGIKSAEAEFRKLSTTAQQVEYVLENLDTRSVKELKQTLRIINKQLESGAVPRNTDKWKFLTAQLKRVKAELVTIGHESDIIEKKGFFSSIRDTLNKNWGAITQFVASVMQVSFTIKNTTQAFADMEEEMADVRKYTGQTTTEVHKMNEEFKKLDTRTSREQLNKLAGAAGRLGITAHDEIMEFVDAADKIDVALGADLGQDAVQNIGKLAMAFGEDERIGLRGAMLASGSAVNELSQNSSASASYLVDFTARLAGVGQVAGMTQAQIMALGSVMDENMQRDEMASTALSNLITKLATDSSKFAKIAGIDIKEFANLVEHDMNGALLKFAKTLQGKGGLMKLAPLFDEMGLDGSRAVGVLTVLANKVDDVRKNQELANVAYEEATSIINEFNVQNTTIQAEIDKNKKKFHDLSVELGEKLLPVVKYTISGGSLLVKGMSVIVDFINNHLTVISVLTASIIAFNAQKLKSIFLDKIWAKGIRLVSFSMTKLNRIILKNPLMAAATAVALFTAAIYDLKRAQDKHHESLMKEQKEISEFNKKVSAAAADGQMQYSKLQKEYEKCKTTHEKREWIKKSQQSFSNLGIAVNTVNTAENIFVKNTDVMMKALQKRAEAMAWESKQTELYAKRNDRQLEIEQKKERIYVGAIAPDVKTYNSEDGLYNLGRDGYYHYTQKGVESAHAILDDDSKLKELDEKIQNISNHAYKAHEEVNTLIESVGAETKGNGDDNEGSVLGKGSDNIDKNVNIKKREAEKKEKADFNLHLTELTALYSKGEISYSDFLERKRNLELESLDKRKAIWGEESNEAKQMADDELKVLQQYDDAKLKQSIENIERNHILTEAQLNADFYDKGSSIYMNEDALNEALFENDMSTFADRIAAEKEGSEQWMRLKAEMQLREQEHQYDQTVRYNDMLIQMRKDYGEYSAEEELKIAINGLDRIHELGLIKEDEYLRMLLHIKAQYADRGPGKNTDMFNEDVNSALILAREKAGDVANHEKDRTFEAIFGNDIQNWRNVNKEITNLYNNDVITHAQANAAKAQNDAEYLDTLLSRTQMMYDMVNNVVGAAAAYSQACSDVEVKKIEKNYDRQIKAAGKNSARKKKLEEQRDEEIRRARNKANNKAVKIQIAQAIATSAMSALEAYASVIKALPFPANMTIAPIAAGMALAAGALQIATIKKQQEAQKEGYYEGGFTSGRDYRRSAGIVHQGEFVANHHAVNNASILPALQLIDEAQRNNTVASITAEDITRAVSSSGTAPAPIVNVIQDTAQLEAVRHTQEVLTSTMLQLQKTLDDGIIAYTTVDGIYGIKKQLEDYNRLMKNK